jgi:hypothetical protein
MVPKRLIIYEIVPENKEFNFKRLQKIIINLFSFNELKESVPLTKNMYFSSQKC